MIHPKDLMIGNRVRFINETKPYGNLMGNDPGGPMQIVCGTVDEIQFYTWESLLPDCEIKGRIHLQDFVGWVEPERLCGIDLTDKILLDCGFIPKKDKSFMFDSYFSKIIFEQSTWPREIKIIIKENENRGEIYLPNSKDVFTFLYNVKLHQLQNIYYILTGTELCKHV